MANRSHTVTPAPIDLKTVAGLALEEGSSYVAYNNGIHQIRYAEVAAAPDPDTEEVSTPIEPGSWGVITVRDDPIYVWTLGDRTTSLRINETE